ncbi:class I SAM-dependent DNA methyltransferase [Listeria welshimeri]|uniref:class I SAM-dependent DNA methyltransferase n=1 Tax=Listeria welshimeri TaxID=1643 RepID=UPI001624632B|nr:class I SAM-dependent methyltransferase [Listeria welshimeri]MBC1476766.1 class I SAM-dependent methyltransferase [Listeria welshimeri]MBC1980078.1 class I SAM-dependent methyltransferase [Listeria welshimeri]MBC2009150.1 class I SAM-dependent methyltransferase [Listeria welshimeri]MBC2041507.1 class I SAM-dependent methyltransferase [Listeria welshimeri]MBF2422574.1 class I SAM-dependent methyltransferase [Listeria welshimeri]
MSYEYFPGFYDGLMDSELYDEWIEFSAEFIDDSPKKVLDLACGTAEFALRLSFLGHQVTGVDLSKEMVAVAKEKVAAAEINLPILEQDMSKLALNQSFDVVTCFCDSLNYLETEQALEETIQAVSTHLEPNGLFLFDVHSVFKIDQGFKDYTYGDSDEEISTIWNSFPGEFPHSVEHELTFYILGENDTYNRVDELHKERTYPITTYENLLKKYNFTKIEVYADFGFEKPTNTSERIFFVARK